jgi:hypothetical protein
LPRWASTMPGSAAKGRRQPAPLRARTHRRRVVLPSIWTGPPRRCPPRRRGVVSRPPGCATPANLRAGRPLNSVIDRYSPWRPPPRFWDGRRRAAGPPPPGRGWSPENPGRPEGELRSSAVTQRRPERSVTRGASKSAPAMTRTPEQQVPRPGRSSACGCLLPFCRGEPVSPREQTGTTGQILPPGRDLAAARSPGTEADSVIWPADPIAIGRRQVTVTECTKQTVTNWLRYVHIAESALEERQAQTLRTALISAIPAHSSSPSSEGRRP